VAVRQAALVSDESTLEACFAAMRYTNWQPFLQWLLLSGFCHLLSVGFHGLPKQRRSTAGLRNCSS